MPLTLYGHPFSSYTQKALIALYEKTLPFTFRALGPDDPAAGEELAALWPHGLFPVLIDGERTLIEATIIVEYVDSLAPGAAPLLPRDSEAAIEARMLDRIFDNYVMTPVQRAVAHALDRPGARDPATPDETRKALEVSYRWLDARLAGREWAAGGAFGLADCAAAPSLFYADWVHPIPAELAALTAYRRRLLARPSFARAVDEARPYRPLFPLGAPDRD